MNKEQVIAFNSTLKIETVFFNDPSSVAGYIENGIIYLNEAFNNLEQVNKHEVLHLYENTIFFKMVRNNILSLLSKEEKQEIYQEYQIRYAGIYSEQEIKNGVLDNEIAIDMIIGNGRFNKKIVDFVDGMFDIITAGDKAPVIAKRYLNLSLSAQIEQRFAQATIWEKLFIINFYDGQKHRLPTNKERKYQDIRNDIQKELNRLYSYADNAENFRIYINNNPDLEREFESEIKALKARGEGRMAQYYLDNKKEEIKTFAQKIAKTQQAEYKHIVDFIKSTEYEPAFKVLMLRETLLKTYKQEKDENGEKTIVHKREEHKSLAGHMTLNEDVLRVIYNNLKDYSNFSNLYFAGLAVYSKKITEKSEITLDGIDTLGMGKWLKFEGKQSNEKEYVKNAQNLASLVQNTPWCTKTLASSQLEQGDFFVFVDNDGNPHIAVKMNGNEIDEVRGIKNGNSQELENDYRPIAIEFLTKNKDIKYGKEWLEKEEWNTRLIRYTNEIENGKLTQDEIPQLVYDLTKFKDYKSHFIENLNKTRVFRALQTNDYAQDIIAKYFACKKEEISFKEVTYFRYMSNCEYKVILGDANFENSEITQLENLEYIGGYADFSISKVSNIGNLQYIGDYADFSHSKISNLNNIHYIGRTVFLTSEQEKLFADRIYKDNEGNWRLKSNLKNEKDEEIENN